MSSFFKLEWKDVLGAIVSSVLVAVIGYVMMVGDVFALDIRTVVNTAVMAGLGSLLKALLTTSEGKFVGAIPVK